MNEMYAFDKWHGHLRNSEWLEDEITSGEASATVFTCKNNMLFQIVHFEESLERATLGPWSKGFPDPACFLSPVELRLAGETVHRLQFAYLDGFRLLVPLPKRRTPSRGAETAQPVEFYYDRNSLEYLVGEAIGQFHIFNSMEGFAQRQGIEILGESR